LARMTALLNEADTSAYLTPGSRPVCERRSAASRVNRHWIGTPYRHAI